MFNNGKVACAVILSRGDTRKIPYLQVAERYRQCVAARRKATEHCRSIKQMQAFYQYSPMSTLPLVSCDLADVEGTGYEQNG